MKTTLKIGLLVATIAFAGCCGTTIADRPCPRVTEFPATLQRRAAEELANLPPGSALAQMMDAIAVDREFNRAVCR